MKNILLLLFCLVLASCATAPAGPGGGASPGAAAGAAPLTQSSADCLARNIKPGPPLQAGSIPEAVLRQRQNGSVAIRYDLANGTPQNVKVVASTPPGLYDGPALEHAAKFRDPGRNTVAGCVMTVDVKFN